MPAAPKSPKRAGAPKGKGAVRAKSGCYTCRIRRKKCDEKPNEDNHCETCVRLRLECLGFGTKRPEWLRDNRNVLAVRDRIKTHLAAQGMIKGHSGAGPRNAEREPPVLRLHDDYPNSTSSASPPTPTLSISSSDDNRRPGLSISSMRDDSHYHPPLQPSLDPYHPGLTPRIQELSPNSPVQPSRGPIYANDIMLPPYNMTSSASPSLDSNWAEQSQISSQTSYAPSDFPSRAHTSSFSTTYTRDYDLDDFNGSFMSNSLVINNSAEFEVIPSNVSIVALASIPEDNYDLVRHYLQNVINIQYLLVDESVQNLIAETLQSSPTARDAACLLSSRHRNIMRHGGLTFHDPESDHHFSRLHQSLVGKAHLSEGEAMAGLHVVSWVLFSGGRGNWQDFLHIACRYADGVLWHPQYQGPQDALLNCSPTTRFIIKTTMWFDVLAAATRVEVPKFFDVFHRLFDPNGAYIDGSPPSVPDELSMLPIMGCENHIVWALAEISNLACWKDIQKSRGALSMPELLKRGQRIEEHIMPPTSPLVFYSEKEQIRLLTSQLFRASARVYLHSVLSGDYPSCKEIADGVADAIDWLNQVQDQTLPRPGSKNVERSVVRSVVFSICICGCLTDVPSQREFFLEQLGRQSDVGNCGEVKGLIQEVWQSREAPNYETVTWRDVMRRTEMLLV